MFFLTVPSTDLYEPIIKVLSPHTCIGKTEYVPLSIMYDKHQSLSSEPSSEISEKPSSAPANQDLPVDSIQNRKRKSDSDASSSDKDNKDGKLEIRLILHPVKILEYSFR